MDAEGNRMAEIRKKANHPTVTIGLILFLVVNIIMLVVGIIKKDECPIKDNIPLYLIVAGAVGIGSKLLPIINRKLEFCLIDLIVSVSYLFEFIWTIVGSVWVYSIYKPNYDPNHGLFCSESAYLLSFWLLTIHWAFMALSIVFACCCCCCMSKSK